MNMSKMAIGDDDKKKLIALGGLVVVLILVMLYLFVFRKGSSTTTAEGVPPTPGMPGDPGMPMGMPGEEAPANAGAPAGGGGGGNVTAVSFASLSGPLSDPFAPEYVVPKPPPPPPEPLPMPEALPTPQPIYPAGLPPAFVAANDPSKVMLGLPPIIVPRMKHASTTPQKFQAPKQAGGSQLATPSFNKRLSGVIIGDSVHALLEVSNASGTETFVVQPGDTIAGIRVLGIQRVQVGGKTVPRMLISENGEEKYVELRSAFSPQTDPQAGGGELGGMPGDPGAFPGNPSIFPAPSMRPGQQVGRGANPFAD